MKTWKQVFIERLLRKRGLFYCGPDACLENDLQAHHPYVLKEADELAQLVEAKLAHDAVFKETP